MHAGCRESAAGQEAIEGHFAQDVMACVCRIKFQNVVAAGGGDPGYKIGMGDRCIFFILMAPQVTDGKEITGRSDHGGVCGKVPGVETDIIQSGVNFTG